MSKSLKLQGKSGVTQWDFGWRHDAFIRAHLSAGTRYCQQSGLIHFRCVQLGDVLMQSSPLLFVHANEGDRPRRKEDKEG